MANITLTTIHFYSQEDYLKVWNGMQGEIDGTTTFCLHVLHPIPETQEECPERFLAEPNPAIRGDEDRPWFDWWEWNFEYYGCK